MTHEHTSNEETRERTRRIVADIFGPLLRENDKPAPDADTPPAPQGWTSV